MTMPFPTHFFFYGTLVAGSANPVARAVHGKLAPLGQARVAGALYAIADPLGWYPMLVPGGAGEVAGALYVVGPDFGEADLATLDAYEGTTEYHRREVIARLADGDDMRAVAYLPLGEVPAGAEPIVGGDFAAWLAQRGLRAFGEG